MFERIWDVSPRSLLQGFSQSLPEQVDWSVTPVRAGNVDQPSSFLKRAWKATSRVISYVIIHPLQTITAGLAVQSVAVVAFQPTVEIEKFSETLLEAGSEFQVNVYTANDQYGPAVTALKDGGFVITWHSMGQDGSGFGVYSRRYTADEVGGPELQVNSYTNSDQDSPSVAALEDGGFVITWHSMGQDGSGHGVYGRRYMANGVGSSEFQVNVYTANYQYGPAVAALKDGGFVIAWQSRGQDGSGEGIYSRLYKPRSSVTPVISPSITNSPTSDAPSFSNTIAHSPGPVLFSTVAQSSLSAERPDNSNNSDWSRCNNISCQLLVGIISSVVGGISTAAFIKYCKEKRERLNERPGRVARNGL